MVITIEMIMAVVTGIVKSLQRQSGSTSLTPLSS